MNTIFYGINTDDYPVSFERVRYLVPLTEEEALSVKSYEDFENFRHRFLDLSIIPPLPAHVLARLLIQGGREKALGDLLMAHKGAFVDIGEGKHVAYVGPVGDAHLRAFARDYEDEVEYGVEIVESPGERYGIVLYAATTQNLQAAKVKALSKAFAFHHALTGEEVKP